MQDGGELFSLSLVSAKLEIWTTLVLQNSSEILLGKEDKTKEPMYSVWKHTSSVASEVRKRLNLRVADIRGIVLEARYNDNTFQGDAKIFLKIAERKHRLYISTSTRNPQVRQI